MTMRSWVRFGWAVLRITLPTVCIIGVTTQAQEAARAAHPSQFTTSAYTVFTPYIECVLWVLVMFAAILSLAAFLIITLLLIGLVIDIDKQPTEYLTKDLYIPSADGSDSRTPIQTRLCFLGFFLLAATLTCTIALGFAMLLVPEGTPAASVAISLLVEYIPGCIKTLTYFAFVTTLGFTILYYVNEHDDRNGTPDIEIGEIGAGSEEDPRENGFERQVDV